MMPGQGISLWKILGVFGAIMMIIVWLGPALVGMGKAIKTGDWSSAFTEAGGRVFAIEGILQDETNYLLSNTDQLYTQIFHLAHAVSLLFMLFFLAFMLFKFANWMIGWRSMSPSSDILIILGIILLFFSIEFFYAYTVLDKTVIPLKDGVFYFVKNLPSIINGMIS